MVFLNEFFGKVDFEKNQQTTKKHEQFPRGQRVKVGDGQKAIVMIDGKMVKSF